MKEWGLKLRCFHPRAVLVVSPHLPPFSLGQQKELTARLLWFLVSPVLNWLQYILYSKKQPWGPWDSSEMTSLFSNSVDLHRPLILPNSSTLFNTAKCSFLQKTLFSLFFHFPLLPVVLVLFLSGPSCGGLLLTLSCPLTLIRFSGFCPWSLTILYELPGGNACGFHPTNKLPPSPDHSLGQWFTLWGILKHTCGSIFYFRDEWGKRATDI